jgi:hypothetical protein
MKKLKLNFKLIAVAGIMMFSLPIIAQDTTPDKGEVVVVKKGEVAGETKSYAGLPILMDLEVKSAADFGQRVDDAASAGDANDLAGLAAQLKYYEDHAGKKSSHLTSVQVTELAASIISTRGNSFNADECDIVMGAAKLVGDSKSVTALTAQKAEAAASGFDEAQQAWTSLYIQNNTYEYVTVYVNGYNRGTGNSYSILTGGARIMVRGNNSGHVYFNRYVNIPYGGYTVRVW